MGNSPSKQLEKEDDGDKDLETSKEGEVEDNEPLYEKQPPLDDDEMSVASRQEEINGRSVYAAALNRLSNKIDELTTQTASIAKSIELIAKILNGEGGDNTLVAKLFKEMATANQRLRAITDEKNSVLSKIIESEASMRQILAQNEIVKDAIQANQRAWEAEMEKRDIINTKPLLDLIQPLNTMMGRIDKYLLGIEHTTKYPSTSTHAASQTNDTFDYHTITYPAAPLESPPQPLLNCVFCEKDTHDNKDCVKTFAARAIAASRKNICIMCLKPKFNTREHPNNCPDREDLCTICGNADPLMRHSEAFCFKKRGEEEEKPPVQNPEKREVQLEKRSRFEENS